MKVRATNEYQERNVTDKELKRIPAENEIFEVTEERYEELVHNDYKDEDGNVVVFVERVEDEEKKTAVPKVKKETAKKKTTTKKTK